ncbi:MAG: cytochrome c3 family protein [Nitrospirae bacterium]|nr:cytochrome c3 family protein [Candidatus Manganitrophaceae bacterium]
MKRWGLTVIPLLTALFAGLSILHASPLDDVVRSRHNLALPSLPPSKTCAICHIDPLPGFAVVPKENPAESSPAPAGKTPPPPLWNRGAALPYHLAANLPAKHHPYNQPTGSSLTCLACHDGALAKDMHGINVDQPRVGASAFISNDGGLSRREVSPLSRVDHPISIPYPRKPSGQFVPENPTVTYARYWTLPDLRPEGYILPETGSSSYLDLPKEKVSSPELLSTLVRTTSGKVECDSCHNPHNESIRPFLRAPSPSLCLVCHDR